MKLLVVDDDPDALVLARFALERRPGCSVVTASDAAGAVEAMRRERPDAVLLDFYLGEHDGLDVLARLAAEDTGSGEEDRPEVIFLTGKGEEVKDCLLAAGARGVIAKPFDPATLAQTVADLLGAKIDPGRE